VPEPEGLGQAAPDNRTRAVVSAMGAFLARWKLPIRAVFMAGMIGFIAWQLWQIGPGALAAEIPTNPLFYLLYWAGFCILPASETQIYRRIWPAAPRVPFRVFLRKRVLNDVVLGYSGDVWFGLWARMRLGIPDRRLLAGIKDAGLLSGAASMVLTALVVLAFVLRGDSDTLAQSAGLGGQADLWFGLAAFVLIALLVVRFGGRALWIERATAIKVFGINISRICLVNLVQLTQWSIVLPLVPFETWLLFIAVQMLINQLPFVPNRDLLFLAAGVELTTRIGVGEAALAAMFVAVTLLKQATNYAVLGITMLMRDAEIAPAGATEEEDQNRTA